MPNQKQNNYFIRVLQIVVPSLCVLLAAFSFWHPHTVKAATGINEQINYQARLLTSTGAVVPDGFYNIEFKIYCGGDGTLGSTSADCTSGTTEHLLWTETRVSTDKVQVKNGYFSVYLGSVNPFGSSVNWNDDKLWLSINVGGTGSPSYDGEMSPFTRFASTPYALNSKYLGGLASSDFVQLAPSATQSISSANAALNITQASTGNLATFDATNSSANGFSIDIQSSSTSQYALNVTSNNGSTIGLSVRADGNVGIGTTTPGEKLEVVGNVISKGTSWTSRTSAADNTWDSVTYGNGIFVAVASSGTGNRVMTSPDGINWTTRTSAADNTWNSVTYGNGIFVAVASSGTGNRVMTSSDGITWTIRTSAGDSSWNSVTYGKDKFVAVSNSGSHGVMTSPDGVNWTWQPQINTQWNSIAYGNGTYARVYFNAVESSTDGINWTTRTSPASVSWNSVTYGNGIFVAVANSGTTNSVMTSPDGATWTLRTSSAVNNWYSVTYGNGLFVAVGSSGGSIRVMTSSDGINWTSRTSAANLAWNYVTYGNGIFVAVASSGTGNRVMTSGNTDYIPFSANNTYQGGMTVYGSSTFNAASDSTTAFQVRQASGTTVLNIDTTNARVGIGTTTPSEALHVAGNVLIGAQADATAHNFGSTCSCSLNSAAGTFGSQTARDAVTASVVYRGKLFVAVKETDAAGIYRYDGGTTWTLVTNAIGKAITGDTANIDQYVMTVFDDTLFIGSQTGANTGAVYSSTTADTTADSFALAQTTRGTFGSTLTTIDGISDLAVYNGALYVGTQEPNLAEVDRWDSNASLVEVSNTTEGRIGGTTSTTTDGVVFAVYEGKLYAGNLTGAAGNAARISQYSGTGTTWTDVTGATAGTIGAETLVDDVVSLAVYNGALYAGTGEAGAANVYKWEQSGTNTSSAAPTVVATDWKKVNNASGKIVSGDTAAAGDSYILKVYNGRLYAGSQGAAGDDAGSLYEYSGDSSIWSLINSTRGTFGAEASTNAISMMQEFNGTFYIGTDEGTNGKASVYTWTKTAKNSYALKFDSGSGNYGQISFVGTSNSASNGGVDGSFLFSHAISLNTGAFDYAEDYPTKDASLVAGDIVSIDPYNKEFVKQATSGSSYVGIVSERPGFRLSQSTEKLGSDRYVPIALVGRVPLNVSAENGPIAAGDPITVSTTTPGIGVKATSPGRIVGYAMEAFNGTGTGKIVVFVNLGHLDTTDLQGQEALFTSLNVSGMSTMSDLTVTGRATIKTLEVTDQATIGTLHVTGNTDIAGELRVGNHIISSGKQPTVIPGAAAGSSTDTQPSVSIDGTDSAGSVAITTGDQSQATGVLAEISFVQAYAAGFRISLTPTNASAVDLRVYAEKTDTGFKIMTKDKPLPQTQYQFDYLVLGTEVSTP